VREARDATEEEIIPEVERIELEESFGSADK